MIAPSRWVSGNEDAMICSFMLGVSFSKEIALLLSKLVVPAAVRSCSRNNASMTRRPVSATVSKTGTTMLQVAAKLALAAAVPIKLELVVTSAAHVDDLGGAQLGREPRDVRFVGRHATSYTRETAHLQGATRKVYVDACSLWPPVRWCMTRVREKTMLSGRWS